MKEISEAIKFLEKQVPDPSAGLPLDLFYFVSRLLPLVNVDLLIKDESGRTLLAWRDDVYCGRGWHIPGGILRFRETLEQRIKKVAQIEIGAKIKFDPVPLAINQLIHPELKDRSHFVSLLYKCFLPSAFSPENKGLRPQDPGFLKWHKGCPDNLIKHHKKYYRKYI